MYCLLKFVRFVCDFNDKIIWKNSLPLQSRFITATPLNLTSLLHLFAKHKEIHTFLFHWMIWSSMYHQMFSLTQVFWKNRKCYQVCVKDIIIVSYYSCSIFRWVIYDSDSRQVLLQDLDFIFDVYLALYNSEQKCPYNQKYRLFIVNYLFKKNLYSYMYFLLPEVLFMFDWKHNLNLSLTMHI